MRLLITTVLLAVLMATGCSTTYYAFWETMGKEKRDILRANVEKARDEQTAASEEFKDALTRLKELYNVEAGELDENYRKFSQEYERCRKRADSLETRIGKVQSIATDLFEEWSVEIEEISSPSLRASSREKLAATQARYKDLVAALEQSEKKMEPVLVRMKDQVLYLKHNLNAQAIGALETEVSSIETDILGLISEMDKSIAEADAFIAALPQ